METAARGRLGGHHGRPAARRAHGRRPAGVGQYDDGLHAVGDHVREGRGVHLPAERMELVGHAVRERRRRHGRVDRHPGEPQRAHQRRPGDLPVDLQGLPLGSLHHRQRTAHPGQSAGQLDHLLVDHAAGLGRL
ncbi:conserved hypothetical protein [Streptomyces misionensis JCM 4497]